MNYTTHPSTEVDAAIEKAASWARTLTDSELGTAERALRGRYLDKLSPRQWAVLLESKRRQVIP